jgi:hypothetical protein
MDNEIQMAVGPQVPKNLAVRNSGSFVRYSATWDITNSVPITNINSRFGDNSKVNIQKYLENGRKTETSVAKNDTLSNQKSQPHSSNQKGNKNTKNH